LRKESLLFECFSHKSEKNKEVRFMSSEIYRPIGITIVTSHEDGASERFPVTNLCVGRMIFSFSSCAKNLDSAKVVGVEVHGQFFEINCPLEVLAESRAAISWSTYSFDFTLFQAWVSGLSIEQKESLITDVLDWHEDLENVAFDDIRDYKESA